MSREQEILEDLMSEIGFEITTLEHLIGQSEVDHILEQAQDAASAQEAVQKVLNIERLKGKRDMAELIMGMIEERMDVDDDEEDGEE